MNKDELLKLSDTLRGIAEGKEWEYERSGHWFLPISKEVFGPIYAVSTGHKIRLKPQPEPVDPYAVLKAAHAAGKTIQCKQIGLGEWWDLGNPNWSAPPSSYRIKPELQKVPLGPDDVPPGTVLRGAGEAKTPEHKGWCMITSSSFTGIRLWRHSYSDQMEITWRTLMVSEYQIWRPTDTSWQPCYKEVTP